MTDIFRVTWPVTINKLRTDKQTVRMADCADAETADQVRDGLVAIGYRQAVVYGVTVKDVA